MRMARVMAVAKSVVERSMVKGFYQALDGRGGYGVCPKGALILGVVKDRNPYIDLDHFFLRRGAGPVRRIGEFLHDKEVMFLVGQAEEWVVANAKLPWPLTIWADRPETTKEVVIITYGALQRSASLAEFIERHGWHKFATAVGEALEAEERVRDGTLVREESLIPADFSFTPKRQTTGRGGVLV